MPSRTDQMISKTKGAMKAVKATAKGLGGVFRVLMVQHGEAAALLHRAKANPSKRLELWPVIREELISHERAELRVLYPELRGLPGLTAWVDHHDREASELESLIGRLHELDPRSAGWANLFDDLIDLVERHVSEEESEIFPRAHDALGATRSRELEDRFMAAKQAAMPTT
jgi:hypothetical protein